MTNGHASETRPRGSQETWGGRLILIGIIGLLVVNLLWMLRSCEGSSSVGVGLPAPDFSVKKLDGGRFQLAEARGQPVLVDFWATWCEPCKISLPILDRLYRRHKERGLRVIAIETDGAEEPARVFAKRHRLSLPIGLEDGSVSRRYGVSTIPRLVLIDASGVVRRVFDGVHSERELSEAVEAAGAPQP